MPHKFHPTKNFQEKERKEQIRKQQIEDRENQYKSKIDNLKAKYGEITIEIKLLHGSWEWDNLSLKLLFFESTQTAFIKESAIPFKKILAYTLTDNQQTITTTKGNADTSTSTGSMAGRALAGGLLLGGVGVLAGATTAKKDTEINTTISHATAHDYIIYLNIDDMANPQRILKFGSDAESANKAASVFNIIINRNK